MGESATPSIRFAVPLDRPLDVRFDAGGVTSDWPG
jgi:hypothetical protein